MTHASPEEQTVFGYLSALQSPEHGYFGGYLIVSSLGRPLEFHCTAPVRPSRAQEILYGPTLRSYLVGEQIGGTLLGAGQLTPRLILTDQPEAISARRVPGMPMVLVLSRQDCDSAAVGEASFDSNAASTYTLKLADGATQSWSSPFAAFNYELRQPCGFESQRDRLLELLAMLAERVDLAEPFGRIHDAIREAQRISGLASEAPGQAA